MLKPLTSRYRHLSFPTVHIFEPFTLFCQLGEQKEVWTFSHMLLEEVRYSPISKTAVVVKLAFAIVSYYSRSVVASVVIIVVVVKIVILVIICYCKRKCKVKNDTIIPLYHIGVFKPTCMLKVFFYNFFITTKINPSLCTH